MRIDSIELDGFRSFGHALIDLTGVHLASVVGKNGNGKSKAFVEAPVFALTGAKTRGPLDDHVMSEPEQREECSVAVVFSPDGQQRYKVTRTRSNRGRGKTTAELVREEKGQWVADTTGSDEVTARVKTLIGADEDLLLVTSIIAQDEAKAFLSKTPAERLEVLGEILSLDKKYGPHEAHWKRQADEAKAALQKARDDVTWYAAECETLAQREEQLVGAQHEAEMHAASVAFSEQVLATAREATKAAEREATLSEGAEERYNALRLERADIQVKRVNLTDEIERLDKRLASRADLEARYAQRPDVILELASLEEAEKSDAAIRQKRAVLDSELDANRLALQEIESQFSMKLRDEKTWSDKAEAIQTKILEIANAEAPVCDRCGQSIEDEALVRTVDQLEDERTDADLKASALLQELEALNAKHQEQNARRVTIRESITALPPYTFDQARYSQLKRLRDELDTIPAKLAELSAAEERRARATEELEEVTRRLEDPKVTAELEKAREAAEGFSDKQRRLSSCRTAERQAEADLKQAQDSLTAAKQTIAAHEEAIKMLLPSREKLEEAKAEETKQAAALEDAEYLKRAFGKYGIPLMIIGNVVADLEREVNELTGLYDGGMHVHFETTKETKAGDTRESLEIIVDRNGYPSRAYSGFSGGEKYRIASCVRLGLALLMARRSSARVRSLVIDEPEGLDESGRRHLVQILHHLADRFDRVLLVSHHTDLLEALPSQILVERGEDGMSHVEVRP